MAVPDPIKDIRAHLLADTGVQALVGTRVFHSELPASESGSMPRQSVVVSQAGGPGRPKTLKTRNLRIDTFCYGATLYESYELHLAVREALETLAHSGSVKTVEMVTDGLNGRDPDKQWPVCFASYRALTAAYA